MLRASWRFCDPNPPIWVSIIQHKYGYGMRCFLLLITIDLIVMYGGDVSSIGACRPRIFFINGFLYFLEDEWQRNGEGREKGDATSRRR